MKKKLFLLIALLWELSRAAGIFFTFILFLNPTYRIETSLMLGWLFSGSLTVFAALALLFFRDATEPGRELLASLAALGKGISAIPGIMLFFLLSGTFPIAVDGSFLLAAVRPVIGLVCFIDLLCIGFLLLLEKRSRAQEDE